jgi:hypothetical protein
MSTGAAHHPEDWNTLNATIRDAVDSGDMEARTPSGVDVNITSDVYAIETLTTIATSLSESSA